MDLQFTIRSCISHWSSSCVCEESWISLDTVMNTLEILSTGNCLFLIIWRASANEFCGLKRPLIHRRCSHQLCISGRLKYSHGRQIWRNQIRNLINLFKQFRLFGRKIGNYRRIFCKEYWKQFSKTLTGRQVWQKDTLKEPAFIFRNVDIKFYFCHLSREESLYFSV